jgi:hypothetical protein
MLCSILNPILDVMQSAINFAFFWASSVGVTVPDARTLFGGFLGCSG